MSSPKDELISLALATVEVLDNRAKAGCQKPPWQDFRNGNGVNVGLDIERLIQQARRIIQTHVR